MCEEGSAKTKVVWNDLVMKSNEKVMKILNSVELKNKWLDKWHYTWIKSMNVGIIIVQIWPNVKQY